MECRNTPIVSCLFSVVCVLAYRQLQVVGYWRINNHFHVDSRGLIIESVCVILGVPILLFVLLILCFSRGGATDKNLLYALIVGPVAVIALTVRLCLRAGRRSSMLEEETSRLAYYGLSFEYESRCCGESVLRMYLPTNVPLLLQVNSLPSYQLSNFIDNSASALQTVYVVPSTPSTPSTPLVNQSGRSLY